MRRDGDGVVPDRELHAVEAVGIGRDAAVRGPGDADLGAGDRWVPACRPLTMLPLSVPVSPRGAAVTAARTSSFPSPHTLLFSAVPPQVVLSTSTAVCAEQRPCARDIASELRRRRPDQRDCARDVGRSHRGPAQRSVGRIAPAHRGADVGARRGNVGLDDASERRRASRREACDRARLRERPGAVGLRVIARRPGSATSRAVVSVREGREDPGRDPRLNGRAEERIAGAAAPRVVDDVRAQVRPGVVAVQVGRRENELRGRDERYVEAAALRGDPLRVRRDADLVRAGIAVVADHRSHRVGAMSVGVARVVRRAFVKRVPPVVVVVEGAAVVPAVLLDEGLMRVADARCRCSRRRCLRLDR